MATLKSSKAAAGIGGAAPHPDGAVYWRQATYALGAALALNDVVEMIPVYAGERVVEVRLITPDLDTNGAPAIVLAVGDGVDPNRYISGSTIGQTGGTAELGAGVAVADQGNLDYRYTAQDTVDILVSTGPATGAATGTIRLEALIARG